LLSLLFSDDLVLKRTTIISYGSVEELPVKHIPFLWSDYNKLIHENVKLYTELEKYEKSEL